eukprot:PhM_4_TR4119/c0_g1_i1/m.66266
MSSSAPDFVGETDALQQQPPAPEQTQQETAAAAESAAESTEWVPEPTPANGAGAGEEPNVEPVEEEKPALERTKSSRRRIKRFGLGAWGVFMLTVIVNIVLLIFAAMVLHSARVDNPISCCGVPQCDFDDTANGNVISYATMSRAFWKCEFDEKDFKRNTVDCKNAVTAMDAAACVVVTKTSRKVYNDECGRQQFSVALPATSGAFAVLMITLQALDFYFNGKEAKGHDLSSIEKAIHVNLYIFVIIFFIISVATGGAFLTDHATTSTKEAEMDGEPLVYQNCSFFTDEKPVTYVQRTKGNLEWKVIGEIVCLCISFFFSLLQMVMSYLQDRALKQ